MRPGEIEHIFRNTAFAECTDTEKVEAYCAKLEEQVEIEKARRTYYQDIVYSVCNSLEIRPHIIVCGTLHAPTSQTQEAAKQMRAERDRLQTIVDKLPKTADGVPVVPGIKVWHRDYLGVVTEEAGVWKPPFPGLLVCCYSTREAAEAAAKDKDE